VDQLVGMGIREVHNGYLETYLNLGWVGVTLLGTIVVTGYVKVVALYRRNPRVGAAPLACFTAAIIYNIFEAGLRSPGLIREMLLLRAVFPYSHREKNR
jgi:O-antigen ligase